MSLFFNDQQRQIIQLLAKQRLQIKNYLFLGRSDPADEYPLFLQAELLQQGVDLLKYPVYLHQYYGVEIDQDATQVLFLEGCRDYGDPIGSCRQRYSGGDGGCIDAGDARHCLDLHIGVFFQHYPVYVEKRGIEKGVADGDEGDVPALADKLCGLTRGVL